jgi:hypothetical protein
MAYLMNTVTGRIEEEEIWKTIWAIGSDEDKKSVPWEEWSNRLLEVKRSEFDENKWITAE